MLEYILQHHGGQVLGQRTAGVPQAPRKPLASPLIVALESSTRRHQNPLGSHWVSVSNPLSFASRMPWHAYVTEASAFGERSPNARRICPVAPARCS